MILLATSVIISLSPDEIAINGDEVEKMWGA
jgi:hypothetical protein